MVEALNDAIEQTEAGTPQESLAGLTAAITGAQSFYRPELRLRCAPGPSPTPKFVPSRSGSTEGGESLEGIWSRILDDPAAVHTAALLPYLVGIGASLVQPPTPPDQLRGVYELLLGLVPNEVSRRC